MKLENVKISDLKQLEKNVRYHTDIQIREFVRSLEQYGQLRAFVIDEGNNVLVGNCMLLAMRDAGWESAMAYRVTGLSEAKKKKLILSDNRIYSLGGDNLDVIELYVQEIAEVEDLDVPGFDDSVLSALIRDNEAVDESVKSYGVVSEDVLESCQKKREAAQNVAESHEQESGASKDAVMETASEAEVVKTVICPNCGEVIRL